MLGLATKKDIREQKDRISSVVALWLATVPKVSLNKKIKFSSVPFVERTVFESMVPFIEDDDGNETQSHILGDIDYVRKSNFLILNIDEGDKPCGTYAEAFLAFERRIPIYMIQNMALYKYNKSLLGWVIGSGGAIFENQKQLLEFLDKEYKLKIKKETA